MNDLFEIDLFKQGAVAVFRSHTVELRVAQI
jgi:hypothetical protein